MKDQESAKKLLSQKGLKRTPFRISLLDRFLETDRSLSYNDFGDLAKSTADKSTIYRNLNRFEQVGLLHRIEDTSGVAKYAFGDHGTQHGHLHFVCESCHNTYCLEVMETPDIHLPKGFQSKHSTTIINGVCVHC